MTNYLHYAIAIVAGIAAGLSTMPYGWAHISATATTAFVGVVIANVGTYNLSKSSSQPQSELDKLRETP